MLFGCGVGVGSLYFVMCMWEWVEQIFGLIGFDVVDGFEIEIDWYNFMLLNSLENYLVCLMQDIFYVEGKDVDGCQLLLCMYMSLMQVCYVCMNCLLIKVIVLGCMYCVDSDVIYLLMFNQVEGLWIDENISFVDFKGVYIDFLKKFFECDDIFVCFCLLYFLFMELLVEIDMMFE